MTNLSRTPFLIAAVVGATVFVLGATISIYTYLNTPGISDVPIYVKQKFLRTESKEIYLSVFPIFEFWVCFMVTYLVVRWNSYSQRAQAIAAYHVAERTWLRDINLKTLFNFTAGMSCAMQFLLLYFNIKACADLLART
jgi:hypothetical protein